MNPGFVYTGKFSREELIEFIDKLHERIILSWELSHLNFPEDVELRDAGSAFNCKLEIRWQKMEMERYQVLVLSDIELKSLPESLERLDGDWKISECVTQLINLNDKRFNPQFKVYPVVNTPLAKLKCKIFYNNKIPIFISPREVIYAQEY